jgi:hypothetical protein
MENTDQRLEDGVIKYRGQLYVALTPQQKELKKDYLLRQQKQQEKGIPTWEQVREMILNERGSDNYGYRLEELTSGYEYSGGTDQLNEIIIGILHEVLGVDVADVIEDLGLHDALDSFLYDIPGAEAKLNAAAKQRVGFPPKDSRTDWTDQLLEWAATEVLMEEDESRYNELVGALTCGYNVRCYRLISLPENVNPASLNGLGIYWSLDEEKVGLYGADENTAEKRPTIWRFAAQVDPESVNYWETVMQHLDPDIGRTEDEVRFLKHSEIYVYDAEEILGFEHEDGPNLEYASYATGRVVNIDAKRRC